mmetsp:Transcript_7396/g.23648  ORF Transcript_7396/g.23648 Transcript_7396/m.23648 type:complete len:143 (-) Transcript_7396:84-512(-)
MASPNSSDLAQLLHYVRVSDTAPVAADHPLSRAVAALNADDARQLLGQAIVALAKERERGGAALAAAEAESESIALSLLATASRLRKEKENLARASEAEGEALVAKVREREGEIVESARAALQQAEVETEHAVNRLRRGLQR